MLTELSDEDIDIGSPRPFDPSAAGVETLGDIWQSNLKYTRRVFAGGENPALVIGCLYVIWQGANTDFVWDGWRAQLCKELRKTAVQIAKQHAAAPTSYMPFYASTGRGNPASGQYDLGDLERKGARSAATLDKRGGIHAGFPPAELRDKYRNKTNIGLSGPVVFEPTSSRKWRGVGDFSPTSRFQAERAISATPRFQATTRSRPPDFARYNASSALPISSSLDMNRSRPV